MEYAEVARAVSPRGEIVLRRRLDVDATSSTGAEPVDEGAGILELRVNGVFVMDDAETSSELALAREALAQVDSPRRVLVGGLGLGFTTHEVLADRRVEHVVVAELEEVLVGWFRDGTVPHGAAYLADHRLSVAVADVRQLVSEATPESLDLVLLDVDNGPDFLVHASNARLYQLPFLRDTRRALRPGGVLAVWSSAESPRLTTVLREVFGDCDVKCVPVTLQGHEDSYWLHYAKRAEREDTTEGEA